MKKILSLILILLICVICVGCRNNEPTKVIDSNYITKNKGILLDKYAIAIDEEDAKNKRFAVFKETSNNRYKKIFIIDEYSKKDKVLLTDEYLYLFYEKGGFIGYDLDSTSKNVKKVEANFDEIDGLIYFPINIYGYKDNYIYISYYKDDSKKQILYAKISDDLDKYISLTSETDIPTDIVGNVKNK